MMCIDYFVQKATININPYIFSHEFVLSSDETSGLLALYSVQSVSVMVAFLMDFFLRNTFKIRHERMCITIKMPVFV